MRSWPLALAVSLLLLTACGSDSKKDPTDLEPPLYLSQTSIANVLDNLKRSYRDRYFDEYRKLLDPSFVFEFAPQDVGGPLLIPESWGRPEDLESITHMFGDTANHDGYVAEEISVTFIAGADESTDLNPSWRKVVLSNIRLEITARNETSDVIIYLVSGDKADLYFMQTGEIDDDSGLPIWKIVRWEDKPMALSATATQQTTWGAIKALWK